MPNLNNLDWFLLFHNYIIFYTSSIKLRIILESPDASFCWSIMRMNHTARSGLNLFAEGRRWRWRNRIGLSGKLFCECKIKIYNSSTNDDIQICSTVRILRFRLSFAYKPLWIFLTNAMSAFRAKSEKFVKIFI